jgi:polyisoprenoid-binding protein YceI
MRVLHTLTFATLAGVLALLAGAGDAEAQARSFKVDSESSQIQFVSDAPLEKFTGTSNKVSGELKVDPGKAAQAKGTVKVEVASIKTGIDLRDEHLQNDSWLDAKKYPHAEFTITKVSGVDKLKPNEAVEATVTGKFSLHGVTQEVTTKARVRWIPGEGGKPGSIRVVGSFPVKLEAHKVSIPKIVALKVSPDIVVNVDIRAVSE